jgi:hypothetical protein
VGDDSDIFRTCGKLGIPQHCVRMKRMSTGDRCGKVYSPRLNTEAPLSHGPCSANSVPGNRAFFLDWSDHCLFHVGTRKRPEEVNMI